MLNISRLSGFFIFILLSLLISCSDDEVIVPDTTKDTRYFPLFTGFWAEFEADSIVHRDTDDSYFLDTAINEYHFYIREEIDSVYMDSENQPTFVIVRYKRENDSLPWTFSGVWTAKMDSYSAQRVEENIRFIRLKFPISSSTYWNGNAYNFYQPEEHSYSNLFKPATYSGLNFDSTVTVIQNNFVSNINRINKKEIYGAGVGLLFKQLDSVRTVNTSGGTIILNGLEYRQTITGYKR